MNNQKTHQTNPKAPLDSLDVPNDPFRPPQGPSRPLNMPLDPIGSPLVSYKSIKGPFKICLLVSCAVKHSWREKKSKVYFWA